MKTPDPTDKTIDFLFENLKTCLEKVERYQILGLISSASFLYLTWKWPWAGKGLLKPAMPVTEPQAVQLEGIPISLSPGLACLVLFVLYLMTSLLALAAIDKIKAINRANPDFKIFITTYPGFISHSEQWLRLSMPVATGLFIILGFLREMWWEKSNFWEQSDFWSLLIPRLLILFLLALPQIIMMRQLRTPITDTP